MRERSSEWGRSVVPALLSGAVLALAASCGPAAGASRARTEGPARPEGSAGQSTAPGAPVRDDPGAAPAPPDGSALGGASEEAPPDSADPASASREPRVPPIVAHPAPPAPGAEGAPVENLVPWPIAELVPETAGAALVVVDGALWAVDGERVAVIRGDGTTPTSVLELAVARERLSGDETLAPVPVAGGAVLVPTAEGFAALERDTLALRWSRAVSVEGTARLDARLGAERAFVVASSELAVALDPATGAELWRVALAGAPTRRGGVRVGGDVVVSSARGLVARDVVTGAPRWESGSVASGARLFDPDGGLLPLLAERTIVLVSLADGTERARIELDAPVGWGRNVVLAGDELYVLVTGEMMRTLEVRRYALSDGRLTWTSPRLDMDSTGFHPSIAVGDDAVYVCATPHVALALGRDRGELCWRGYPSACHRPTTWRPRPGAPEVVLFAASAATAYARAADAPRPRRVRVRGVVRCLGRPAANARIWVGSDLLRTDASGRYDARVRVAGTLGLRVEQYEANALEFCLAAWRVVDVPEGATSVREDFDLALGGGGDLI